MKVIETGIDELVERLKKKGEIGLEKASESLGYPEDVVEEWAKVLEEHEVIEIDYGITGTTLRLNKHDEEKKAKAKEKIKNDKEEKFTCDTCGKSFDSEHGLLTHRGMVHKEGD